MSVQYVLYKNKLTDSPNDYTARVRSKGTVSLDDLVDRMVKLEGSTATRADVLSTLEDFFFAIEDMLSLGFSVRTPAANFRLGMKGVFEGQDDVFDPNRHRIVTQVSTGPRLAESIPRLVQVDKQPMIHLVPCPETYSDAGSGTENDQLTPSNIGKLIGYYLRFDPDDPDQGLFFLDANGGETRVTSLTENRPRVLHFLVPDLVPGSYRLEVRTGLNSSGEMRRGALDAVLTVS